MEERHLRDKQFHECLYSEGGREAASKYYRIVGDRNTLYDQLLTSHCSDRRILELGCGQGEYTYFLAEKGDFVTAIDLSEIAIEQAQESARLKNLDNTNFQVMNAEQLDFDDDAFDVVCGGAIVHHLDLCKAFSEITRVLQPHGVAIFMEPLGHNPLINLYRKLTPSMRLEEEHPLRMEDLDFLRSFFKRADLHYFHLLSLMAVLFDGTRFFTRLLRILNAADRFLFRNLPFMRRYAWYCVMVFDQPK